MLIAKGSGHPCGRGKDVTVEALLSTCRDHDLPRRLPRSAGVRKYVRDLSAIFRAARLRERSADWQRSHSAALSGELRDRDQEIESGNFAVRGANPMTTQGGSPERKAAREIVIRYPLVSTVAEIEAIIREQATGPLRDENKTLRERLRKLGDFHDGLGPSQRGD